METVMSNVSRGLVTLKRGKVAFLNELQIARFAGVFRNGVETSTGVAKVDFENNTRVTIQSLEDRLKAEFKLRCAINKINSETIVSVGGDQMTIAEALTYKTHILPQIKTLHDKLVADLAVNRKNYSTLDREYDSKIAKLNGDDEDLRAILEKRDRPEILDTTKEIESLRKKLEFFDLEFDAILSEVNPTLEINV